MKNEVIQDQYYLNFPVAIYKKDIYEKILNYSFDNYKNIGLEPGLTKAWFELGINKEYDVLIYLKNELLNSKHITYEDFYKNANMQFWNNDENLRHKSINDRQNTIF